MSWISGKNTILSSTKNGIIVDADVVFGKMDSSRHQCLVYAGPPSRHLPALTSAAQQKLNENYRCMFLNTPVMVAGMRNYLAATGIDVAREVAKTSLVLSSERKHLVNGCFDVEGMLRSLAEGVEQALADGFAGLWATGDLTWEFGPAHDFGKLLEYEWGLEEAFRKFPALSGICQYHIDTLPLEAVKKGLVCHQSLFVNETLSNVNPFYVQAELYQNSGTTRNSKLESLIAALHVPLTPAGD